MRQKKANNSKGFTLAESLVSIVIVIMVFFMLTNVVELATGSYEETAREVAAEKLMSTLKWAISYELSRAVNVEYDTDNGGDVGTYFSCANQMGKGTVMASKQGYVYLKSDLGEKYLINKGNYLFDLGVLLDYNYDGKRFQVYLVIADEHGNGQIIKEVQFSVLKLNPGK